jgi:hypothetical protein
MAIYQESEKAPSRDGVGRPNSAIFRVFGVIVLVVGLSAAGYISWSAKLQEDDQYQGWRNASERSISSLRDTVGSIGSSNFRSDMDEHDRASDRERKAWADMERGPKHKKTLAVLVSVVSIIVALLLFMLAGRLSA